MKRLVVLALLLAACSSPDGVLDCDTTTRWFVTEEPPGNPTREEAVQTFSGSLQQQFGGAPAELGDGRVSHVVRGREIAVAQPYQAGSAWFMGDYDACHNWWTGPYR